jgi:hypothetical protein
VISVEVVAPSECSGALTLLIVEPPVMNGVQLAAVLPSRVSIILPPP